MYSVHNRLICGQGGVIPGLEARGQVGRCVPNLEVDEGSAGKTHQSWVWGGTIYDLSTMMGLQCPPNDLKWDVSARLSMVSLRNSIDH